MRVHQSSTGVRSVGLRWLRCCVRTSRDLADISDVIQQLKVPPGSLNVDGDWTPTRTVSTGTDTIRFKCRNIALQSGKEAVSGSQLDDLTDRPQKVRVDQSMVAGYGLFAEEDIEKWETVGGTFTFNY